MLKLATIVSIYTQQSFAEKLDEGYSR
jgi:hypothetical protein